MRELALLVEQLDLAAQLIKQGNSTAGRLALILTDNVVELLLHRSAESQLRYGRIAATERKRRTVLGRKFDPKVGLAESEKLITTDDAELCRRAHQLRNEAYHVGILHDAVIHELASTYHQFACSVFPKLKSQGGSFRSDEPTSPALLEHLGEINYSASPFNAKSYEKIMKSLIAKRGPAKRLLGVALSESAVQRLADVESAINFVAEEGAGQMSRKEQLDHLSAQANKIRAVRATEGERKGPGLPKVTDGSNNEALERKSSGDCEGRDAWGGAKEIRQVDRGFRGL